MKLDIEEPLSNLERETKKLIRLNHLIFLSTLGCNPLMLKNIEKEVISNKPIKIKRK